MRVLRYYYYRIYSYYSKGDPDPYFATFLVIFLFGFFNFLAIIDILFSVIAGNEIIYFTVKSGIGRLWPALIILPLFSLFYYYFKKRGYHEKILEEFKNETRRQRLMSRLFVILYFMGSIALMGLGLWARQVIRGY